MLLKKGEVVSIASGIFESYSREGPFVATQDFDLGAYVAKTVSADTETWEVTGMLWEVPRLLVEQGLLVELPCRRVHLGASGEVDLTEEKKDF
ncbi:hypothetical protein [Pseudomonas viridiflava]|jgi:hypothetical protein|uniref:hypothetical protein n=1 Tax=Pseudomonas viridiflava TaxID=33069 RepID=UPI000F088181|nr:hypothetical protein [Pseudomonas viridiflava]QXG45611.1 hypothetical protein KTT57_18520 [Pseudomonas viridiflava]